MSNRLGPFHQAPTAADLCRAAEQAFHRQDFETAESTFRRCLALFPRCAPAFHGLGVMAFAAGELADAADLVTEAVTSQPAQADSWLFLAQIQSHRNLASEALRAIEEGLRLRPADARMWDWRGRVERQLGRLGAAHASFTRAAELDPRNRDAIANARKSAESLGRMEEALWRIRQLVEAEPNSEARHSEELGLLCADPTATEETLFRASSAWARCLAVTPDIPARKKLRRPSRPRLGFFSSSFHGHVISRFFLPLLAALPRDGFESVHLFHDGPVQDEITNRLRAHADGWTNIHPLPDRAAQEKIAAAEIDILVDLNGHFDLSRLRLFAQPLAPVMVHYLGGACTTGLKTIGYRIADSIAEPPGESDRWSTETILRLPRGFHCYAPLHPTAEPSLSPARANSSLTFGTTAALYKLNPDVLEIWGKLLGRVPGSRLLVIKEAFADSGTREDVARRFAAAGISAGQCELRSASREAFTRGETWAEIDVALDPFPYNGVTTTCEALWMGVPVIALRGRRLIARTAASILTHLGRREWVAEDAGHYVAIAAGLAADREKLASIRAGLRSEVLACPLGQPRIVAADLADALLKIGKP